MAMHAPPSENKEFERPKTGLAQGVCVDIRYLGRKRVEYKGKPAKLVPKVLISFQINQRIKEGNYAGERFMISERATWSLFGSAHLRGWLEAWLGRKLTDAECDSNDPAYFDFESLLGLNATLSLVETKSNGRTYTNINSIMPWDTNFGPEMSVENYVRMIERPDYVQPVDDTLDGTDRHQDNGYERDDEPAQRQAEPRAQDVPASEALKQQVVAAAKELWGPKAKEECANRYPAFGQMTKVAAEMALREIEEFQAEKDKPAPVPVAAGRDPFDDDFDDADPFADQ